MLQKWYAVHYRLRPHRSRSDTLHLYGRRDLSERKESGSGRTNHTHRLRNRSLAFGWVNRPIEPTAWPEAQPQTTNWHRLFYCTHTMAQKLTANRSSAREARGLVEQMTCPTPRPPWPARGPLGRLREARQDPGEARTDATIGACPQED